MSDHDTCEMHLDMGFPAGLVPAQNPIPFPLLLIQSLSSRAIVKRGWLHSAGPFVQRLHCCELSTATRCSARVFCSSARFFCIGSKDYWPFCIFSKAFCTSNELPLRSKKPCICFMT
jgi:hypothetical protein